MKEEARIVRRPGSLTPADPLLARPASPLPNRSDDLALLGAQVEAIRREAAVLAAGLTDDQFNWQPDPTRWSIAHCLQHLVVSADGFHRAHREAIDRARRRGLLSDGPYRYGRLGSMFATSMEPPIKRRFKARRSLAPAGRHSLDMLLPAFERRHEQMLQVLESARGIDLGRTRVPLPGVPILRMSLGQSFAFMLGHERRHMWQARMVREDAAFPRRPQ